MLDVFISYAREDHEVVDRLHDDLSRPGIAPWLDRERLDPGKDWNREIDERIRGCSHFLAVVSPHSLRDDRFVRREWDQALAQDKYVMPLRLEDCALPDALKAKQWQDLFPYDRGIVRLLRFLHQEKRSGIFEETFSCNGADNRGWVLDGWELDAFDHTGRKSQSLHARADLMRAQQFTVARTATIEIQAARAATLTYQRRLQLATFLGETSFTVSINDGREQIVDEQSGAISQDRWEERRVQLPEPAAPRIRLSFRVRAHSSMNYIGTAEAWIDDLRVT
jgi:hypothetical protein